MGEILTLVVVALLATFAYYLGKDAGREEMRRAAGGDS